MRLRRQDYPLAIEWAIIQRQISLVFQLFKMVISKRQTKFNQAVYQTGGIFMANELFSR